jgi:hypothetical protein
VIEVVAFGRAPGGALVVSRAPNTRALARSGSNTTGQFESIEDAARELAHEAFAFFADDLRAEIPKVLEENRPIIRDTVADSIKLALGESQIEERLAAAEQKFVISLAVATAIGIVGGALFERLIS